MSNTWPLVLVRWVDSTAPRGCWIRLAEWEGPGSLDCVSVGYLIRDDGKSKSLAPHLAYPDDAEQCQGSGIIVIPVQAILACEILTVSSSRIGSGHGHIDALTAYAARDHSVDHPVKA